MYCHAHLWACTSFCENVEYSPVQRNNPTVLWTVWQEPGHWLPGGGAVLLRERQLGDPSGALAKNQTFNLNVWNTFLVFCVQIDLRSFPQQAGREGNHTLSFRSSSWSVCVTNGSRRQLLLLYGSSHIRELHVSRRPGHQCLQSKYGGATVLPHEPFNWGQGTCGVAEVLLWDPGCLCLFVNSSTDCLWDPSHFFSLIAQNEGCSISVFCIVLCKIGIP